MSGAVEDWERWPQPRDRNAWKIEVRDRWTPWLRDQPDAALIIGNDSSIWTRVAPPSEARTGTGSGPAVSFWQSGANVVSDIVLCKLHDDFVVWTGQGLA